MIVKKQTVSRAGSALTFPHSLMLQLRQSQSQRHKILACQLHEMRTLCSLLQFIQSKLILDVSLMNFKYFEQLEKHSSQMLGEIFLQKRMSPVSRYEDEWGLGQL